MSRAPEVPSSRAVWVVIALGFAAVVFDGYDLIVFGSAVPALLAHPEWQLSPAEVGFLGGLALFGMFFGVIGVGAVTTGSELASHSSDASCGSP